jgi:large subunit ribosomal protein L1
MAKKNSPTSTTEEIVITAPEVTEADAAVIADSETVAAEAAVAAKVPKVRSAKYQSARALIDRTIDYPLDQAVEMVKRVSYSKFPGTITLHVNLKKEMRPTELSLPFSTGKTVRVAIANDELLAALGEGKIDFDVLIATPQMMPKLAKFARVLGPKGLMPNPKNGTVTNDPEAKKSTLATGSITLKNEKKSPLVHVRVGKTTQPNEELVANVAAMIKAIGVFNVTKATIAPSMGPGVKIKVEK